MRMRNLAISDADEQPRLTTSFDLTLQQGQWIAFWVALTLAVIGPAIRMIVRDAREADIFVWKLGG